LACSAFNPIPSRSFISSSACACSILANSAYRVRNPSSDFNNSGEKSKLGAISLNFSPILTALVFFSKFSI
jgi:hypothetical protein